MDEVAEVKHRLGVAEVVGGYLPLKQAGRNLKASCPFHNEKTASFMVSPEKGIWHCFGCGQGGDIFKFVMMMDGLEFRPALEKLAERAGVELKQRGSPEITKLKKRLSEAHQLAAKYYQATLVKNKSAFNYLIKDRRLNKSSINDFQIGYAPENYEALSKFLISRGFTKDELTKGSLAGTSSRDDSIYDLFRGRIMFPISDASGKVVAFTGRVLDPAKNPKYYNSQQTLIYDKGRSVYGLHLAKEAIREADLAVLVEGNMDVVASHQAGIRNVVAASGTALTSDQLKALSHFSKNVALAFDQDVAGIKATERAIELAQQLGLTLKVIEFSAKDPDELIAKSPDLWASAIKSAKYAIDYLFDRLAREYDLTSAVGKRQYSDRLAANLRRLSDPVEREHYLKLLAERVGTSLESVKQKVDQSPASALEPAEAAIKTKPIDAQTALEVAVLAINLAHPRVRMSLDDLENQDFVQPEHQEILAGLKKLGKSGGGEALIKLLPEQADYVKILELKGEQEYADLAPADCSLEAFTLVRNLRIGSNKRQKIEVSKQLREAEQTGNAELVRTLTRQFQALMTEEL
ncbi:MAG TPA: DNA primase [Candidatus Saccharimonadales bacterium]|nr:DNA primase [Candidatus Saccharimonadales bacterium]